jgi:valyl-tRNA synthetase
MVEKKSSKLRGMFSNEKFVANAPEHIVEENCKALAEA